MRKLILAAAMFLFVAAISSSSASGEALGSTIAFDALTRNVALLPGSGVIVQSLVEGDPGAISTTRRGEAHVYVVSILEGSLTYTFDNARTETFQAGQTLVIPRGTLRVFRNDGSRTVRLLESVFTPPGTPPPAAVIPPPTTNVFRPVTPIQPIPSPGLPDRVDVSQQSVGLDPGYRSLERVANGGNAIAVLAGFVTLRYRDGATSTHGPGSSFTVGPGRPFTIVNESPAKASYVATWLGTPGVPALSVPSAVAAVPAAAAAPSAASAAPAVAPPRTGDGGLLSPSGTTTSQWTYVFVVALLAVVSGVGAYRIIGLRSERTRS